jgi:hypothetical protein
MCMLRLIPVARTLVGTAREGDDSVILRESGVGQYCHQRRQERSDAIRQNPALKYIYVIYQMQCADKISMQANERAAIGESESGEREREK